MGFGFGLGNLWRFPYVVYENGGGAFLLLYFFFAILIALPLLISELLIGKIKRNPISVCLESLATEGAKVWHPETEDTVFLKGALRYIAYISVFVCLLVLTYFAVISGWVLFYFTQFSLGLFDEAFQGATILSTLKKNGWLQVGFAGVHMLIVLLFVLRTKKKERPGIVGYLMPLFVILVVVLAVKSLSLDTATEALKYLFYPDFSKLKITSPAAALGHLLFTLSMGFGVMITFGSYFRSDTSVPRASLQILTMDTLVSIFAALLVFPLVMSIEGVRAGPELLFQTVPVLLSQIKGGVIFGVGFFICLYVAALGSSIGLLETIIDNVSTKFETKRSKAAIVIGGVCVVMSILPSFSSNFFSHILTQSGGVFKLWDELLINWTLPLLTLIVSQVALYKLDQKTLKQEFFDESSPMSPSVYTHWRFIIKWAVVPVTVVCLVLQLIGLF